MTEFDLTVIGGGINGVSIAAESASRGLRTLLIHSNDLASSASATPVTLAGTHLEHLSALDYFQLNTMLEELEALSNTASHLVDFMPIKTLNATPVKEKGQNIVEQFFQGIKDKALANQSHFDINTKTQSLAARIKPARLIISKAIQAKHYGASIRPYHCLREAERHQDHWRLSIENRVGSTPATPQITVKTKLLVNSGGWWANELLEKTLNVKTRCKASEEHRTQFYFRNPGVQLGSNQVIKIPGPTKNAFYVYPVNDTTFAFGPRKCDQHGYAECVDLQQLFMECWNNAASSLAISTPLSAEHFVHKRKERLALIADPCANADTPITAPLLDLNNPGKTAILLNIFGADAVLHRKVAQQALDVLLPFHGKKANSEFAHATLPGGQAGTQDKPSENQYLTALQKRHPTLSSALLSRLSNHYGSLADTILVNCNTETDLGVNFGHHLYETEVRYLVDTEWATNAHDILWRRTLLGLAFDKQQTQNLQEWIEGEYGLA